MLYTILMRIIGGRYRGKKINAPPHQETRPTSDRTRETIYNILLHNPLFGPRIFLDKRILDVFAGTGALGLEAFSRGAKTITFVENNRKTLVILHSNLKNFNLSFSCILEQDARLLGLNPHPPFDLIFLDPPYHQSMVLPTLIQLYSGGWISDTALILIELAKDEMLSLPSFLSLALERNSGAAKLLFCSVRK